ncbi:Myc-type, basic helix-loop-helix (bHLH) domain-containing protein [Artemisia annua]|uniref:Myc-type, basic helix-loop-helix (BHLH) domain-containing protein n=1 Tax=Artemisia annua TaxID=35608 RepID=A0A2U1L3W8_ARTAN|nr:Myc-type, basic helix-loop-helix (bHLH) domain-containing protein [Artemisia annua]
MELQWMLKELARKLSSEIDSNVSQELKGGAYNPATIPRTKRRCIRPQSIHARFLSSDDKWMYAPIAYSGMDMGLYQNIS